MSERQADPEGMRGAAKTLLLAWLKNSGPGVGPTHLSLLLSCHVAKGGRDSDSALDLSVMPE